MRFSNPILFASAAAAQAAYAPTEFTSTFEITATPDQVVDANNTLTGGLSGAAGTYRFNLNSAQNIICYDISISGFRGNYQSPASTATHIHEAVAGKAGPPRIAFPNPVDDGSGVRRSQGCLQGTAEGFVTGVMNAATMQDQGHGFSVKRIEDNPAGFFADVHSSEAVPGAVRGQFGAAIAPSASMSMSMPASMTMSTVASSMPMDMETMIDGVTVTVPCSKYPTCHGYNTPAVETPAASAPVPPYGTGAMTMPAAGPQATGGYAAPPADGAAIYTPPAGPTPTPYDGGSGAAQPSAGYGAGGSGGVEPFTGGAAKGSVLFGGLVEVVVLAGVVLVV